MKMQKRVVYCKMSQNNARRERMQAEKTILKIAVYDIQSEHVHTKRDKNREAHDMHSEHQTINVLHERYSTRVTSHTSLQSE